MSPHPFTSTLETVKYWAGQKLLHSPLHTVYLKLTGYERKLPGYEDWLAAEASHRPAGSESAKCQDGYRILLPDGARLAPDAWFWFRQAITETAADLIYADEDVLGADGRRTDPVFKPAWSPELYQHCDYLGGACLLRNGADLTDLASRRIVQIPRVLFHRATPAAYSVGLTQRRAPILPPPPTSSSLVSIIICSRDPALAGACLDAIRSKTGYGAYEILLVDHRAGMSALAGRTGAKLLSFDEDFNFARMCNAGAKAAQGELLLFLNDDTAPLEPHWMTVMASQAERSDVGAVGAFLTYPDGRIQHAGIFVGTPNGAGHPGRFTKGSPIWPWLPITREQSAVTGACLMTRRSVFEQLRGFDESFPVNYNDVDFCLRCGKSGFKVILEGRARVEHRESASRKTGIRYAERRRFLDRWADQLDRGDRYLNPNLTENELLLPDPEAFKRVITWR